MLWKIDKGSLAGVSENLEPKKKCRLRVDSNGICTR